MNIAVVVSGGLAETLLATPLLRTLRAGLPDARLTLLCPGTALVLADGIPAVDEIIALAGLNTGAGGAADTWWQLRKRRLDAVAICSTRASLRAAAYLAAVPRRVGACSGVSRILLTSCEPVARGENLGGAWLRLAARLGVEQELHSPEFEPGPEARAEAETLLRSSSLDDGRLMIAVAPGTGFAETRAAASDAAWEPERYAHLANQLAVRHGAGILLIGTPSDRDVIETTMLDLGASAMDLSGPNDLRVVAALLARCDLFVGGDTPLLHLAAAVGTPSVGLFGPTDGGTRGPYGADHRVIQALTRRSRRVKAKDGEDGIEPSVMEQIRVEDVLAGVEATF